MIDEKLNYKINNHTFRIRFLRNTFVKAINDYDSLIPFDQFDFVDFDVIKARAGDRTLLTGTELIGLPAANLA
ncbi:conserved hypothetical protein [Ricinus communis]|uniref:DUF223 domain-containing protein n=1 Tax=Ricinus communis TaxID=3988 RepID=B9SA92_RICCO|nr:conserved hypothetical protein [Ricinus communis]